MVKFTDAKIISSAVDKHILTSPNLDVATFQLQSLTTLHVILADVLFLNWTVKYQA